MKRLIIFLAFFVLGTAAIALASQQVETLVSEPPQVQQVTGATEAILDPGKYPQFNTISGGVEFAQRPADIKAEDWHLVENDGEVAAYHPGSRKWHVYPKDEACDLYLKNTLSGAKSNVVPAYTAKNEDESYICEPGEETRAYLNGCRAKHNANVTMVAYTGKAITEYNGGYVSIGDEGLKIIDFVIPSEYRKTAKVRIDWTVRIEGKANLIDPLTPQLCKNWHYGRNSQTFDGGNASTKLFVTVDGELVGSSDDFIMSIPDAGTVNKTHSGVPNPTNTDPTLVGSYLISPADFGGMLPAKMSFEVKWKNETSQELSSPVSMRNLVVTLVPTTKE